MGRVLVSGCFDNLHSGHIQFLEEASRYGSLYVVVAQDETIRQLKHREPFCSQQERLYCVQAICYVYDSCIAPDVGYLDFLSILQKSDVFIVNEDGHSEEKQKQVEAKGATYRVLRRETRFETRCTTLGFIPYRIEIAGAWLDQPAVRDGLPGMTITASIKPQLFFPKGGLAGSVRNVATRLWNNIPDNYEEAAELLFRASNCPGADYVSGAQDAIGICFPGISIAYYEGSNWYPVKVETIRDEETVKFLEENLSLFYLGPRRKRWCPEIPKCPHRGLVKKFCTLTHEVLERIVRKERIGHLLAEQRIYQDLIFQGQLRSDHFDDHVIQLAKTSNWKFNGAGGGGYALVDNNNHIKFEVRR